MQIVGKHAATWVAQGRGLYKHRLPADSARCDCGSDRPHTPLNPPPRNLYPPHAGHSHHARSGFGTLRAARQRSTAHAFNPPPPRNPTPQTQDTATTHAADSARCARQRSTTHAFKPASQRIWHVARGRERSTAHAWGGCVQIRAKPRSREAELIRGSGQAEKRIKPRSRVFFSASRHLARLASVVVVSCAPLWMVTARHLTRLLGLALNYYTPVLSSP